MPAYRTPQASEPRALTFPRTWQVYCSRSCVFIDIAGCTFIVEMQKSGARS